MNKRTTALLLVGALLALTIGILYAAEVIVPSKNYVTRTLDNAKQFDAIAVVGTPSVVYTQKAGAPSVSIYCPENMYDLLDVNTNNGTLTVKFKHPKNLRFNGKYKVIVTASSNELNKVNVTGTGDVELKGNINSKNLDFSVSGTGDIKAYDITCDKLKSSVSGTGDVEIRDLDCNSATLSVSGTGDIDIKNIICRSIAATVSGTGDIELKGMAEEADFSVSGTGDISAKSLIAKDVKAYAHGTGDVECHATESLYAKTSGVADITYYGNPKSVTKDGKSSNIKSK